MEWYFHLIFGILAGVSFLVGYICAWGAKEEIKDYIEYKEKMDLACGIMLALMAAAMFFLSGMVLYGAIFGIE